MAIPEIDSFVLKFKNLLLAGINANLTINSKAGKAFLPLAAEVDVRVPHPHHAGAARLRRRERRAAERAAAATDLAGVEVADQAEKANANKPTEIVVSEADSDTEDDTIEEVMKTPEKNKVTDEATEKVVEKAAIEDTESDENKELACDKCAFVGKTLAGLKTHQTTKHKNHSGRKSLFTII